MNANLLFGPPIRKLAFAALTALASALCVAVSARADEAEFARIEIWQGVQKINVAEVRGLTGVPDNVRRLLPFTLWKEKHLPAPNEPTVVRVASWAQPLRARLNSFPAMSKAATAEPLIPKPISAALAGRPIKDPKPIGRDESQEAKLAPAAKEPTPAPAPVPAATDSLQFALLQVALVFSAAVVAPLVFVVSFFRLLRRHSRQFGPLFRFDQGNQPIVAGPFSTSALGLAGNAPAHEGAALDGTPAGNRFKEQAPEHTPEQFELGPSYEEERLTKQRHAEQQEQAALERLIEDNLRFQEEIRESREGKESK